MRIWGRTDEWELGAEGSLQWIRAGGLDDAAWEKLASEYELHPLAVEDVRNPRQRPKLEKIGEERIFITRMPDNSQVGVFMGDDFVVTAANRLLPELDAVEKRLSKIPSGNRLFHSVIDALIDAWFPFVDQLEDQVEALEDRVLLQATQDDQATLHGLKRASLQARKQLVPLRDATAALGKLNWPSDDAPYFADLMDHTTRLVERIDHVRELCKMAQDSWNATLANGQNAVMKRLTVVAGLLLVPSLLAGLGGMNFDGFPAWDYWTVTMGILALACFGFATAFWKKWL